MIFRRRLVISCQNGSYTEKDIQIPQLSQEGDATESGKRIDGTIPGNRGIIEVNIIRLTAPLAFWELTPALPPLTPKSGWAWMSAGVLGEEAVT